LTALFAGDRRQPVGAASGIIRTALRERYLDPKRDQGSIVRGLDGAA
jgi:hypothetical protein